jgi:hypothetical protein
MADFRKMQHVCAGFDVFRDRIISSGIWAACSPSPYDFFFWGCLKDNVYKSNSQTEEELKENICSDISSEQLEILNWNLFHECEECLHVKRQHFQHLL